MSKDTVEYQNRKYSLSFAGATFAAGATGASDFSMIIRPPNEQAFSNNFSQCLVKINRVMISNSSAGPAATERGEFRGADSIWVDRNTALANGVGTNPGVIAQKTLSNGILLQVDIPTRNNLHYGATAPAAQGGGNREVSGVTCIIPNGRGLSEPSFGRGAGVGGAGAIPGININGVATITGASDAAGSGGNSLTAGYSPAPSFTVQREMIVWKFQDDRSVEDAGVLCGNPFGRPIKFSVKDPIDGGPVILMTPTGSLGAAIGGVAQPADVETAMRITVELDILMLPNP